MGETVRGRNADGKLTLRRDTTIGEDVKDIVTSVARALSPRVLRERKLDLDAQERQYDGQTTDSNNKY
jgi:hypothetical protein